jgi:hypothetical protein
VADAKLASLDEDIDAAQGRVNALKTQLGESKAAAKQAQETQKHWEKVADEAKKKAAEDMIAAEE